jgi:hypothetical protein
MDTFPNVGMVSGLPVRSAANRAVTANRAFISEPPAGVLVETERWIPDEWERDWAVSTGRNPEDLLTSQREQTDLRLTLNGVEVYPAANHFQYLAPREVLLKAIPKQWSGRLMGQMVELDQSIDTQNHLRLSTTQRYVRHIGNVVSQELAEEIKAMDIRVEGRSVTRREKRHWLLNIPRMRPLLEKVYGKVYDILNHVREA